MSESLIEWIASFIAVGSSTFRSFNFGYQRESYIISIFSYIVFIFYAEKQSQIIMNIFYILTALVGAWRWSSKANKNSKTKLKYK